MCQYLSDEKSTCKIIVIINVNYDVNGIDVLDTGLLCLCLAILVVMLHGQRSRGQLVCRIVLTPGFCLPVVSSFNNSTKRLSPYFGVQMGGGTQFVRKTIAEH